ncbi:kinase-like protein, partial [Cylindrobasidium torrendii FP15055 ss-10]
RVSIADFELLRVIGQGVTAKVFLARQKGSNRLCALKAQKKSRAGKHRVLRQMIKETDILKQLATGQNNDGEPQPINPFVVKLRWMFHNEAYLFLAFDFHAGGDIGTMLGRYKTLPSDVTRFYAAELVAAITSLHAQGIVHRDIKPENVLIDHEGHIVLTDFGMATQFSTIPSYPGDEMESSLTFCGSDIYLAPEVLQGLPYSFPVDWWALGTMIFEMLAGVTPFMAESKDDMFTGILEDEIVFPDEIKTELDTTDLIYGLLQKDPEDRLSRFDVKEHPYFAGIEWDKVYNKDYEPVHVPELDSSMDDDTQNFEEDFLDMKPILDVEVLGKSKPAFKSAYLFNTCYYDDDEQNADYTSD